MPPEPPSIADGRAPDEARRVSVIVNTNGRRDSLCDLLRALPFQRHGAFEVIVVCGPEADGTRETVAGQARAGRLKMVACGEANLALSRNLGLAAAAGELVAFIDDDAIPEPVWLEELVAAFADGAVAGAGGRVYGPDGRSLQFLHSLCDRCGDTLGAGAAPEEGFPFGADVPHLMGTNAVFRRSAVAALGGFDEFYRYFLEETDLCLRLTDAGWAIRQTGRAPVHHRFLAGTVRGEGARALPLLRSRIYFPLVNGADHLAMEEILLRSVAFVEERRARVRRAVAAQSTHPLAEEEFDEDAQAAWREALLAGLSGRRLLRPPSDFADPPAFLPFPSQRPDGPARHWIALAPRRPAQPPGAAVALARAGHLVRILHPARADAVEDAGFVEGVFLQAVPVEHAHVPPPERAATDPAIWAASATLLAEIERLNAVHPVDAVVGADDPLAVALCHAKRFRLVGSLAEVSAGG